MIEFAVTVTAFSFLHIVLNEFLEEELSFRISSGLLFVFAIPILTLPLNL